MYNYTDVRSSEKSFIHLPFPVLFVVLLSGSNRSADMKTEYEKESCMAFLPGLLY